MTDQVTDVASGGSEPAPIAIPEHKAGGDGNLSMRDAARSVVDWRRKGAATEQIQGDGATDATTAQESEPQGEDAAPPQEATGETEVQSDPAEMPPLDLPRSWTKEQAEHWKALPRATQEYLIEQAGKESAAVRKAQNEAAEARKAIEAERQRLQQLASQYESALPNLQQAMAQELHRQFPEIKTWDDVEKMQAEDPIRYQQWQIHTQKLAAAAAENKAAEERAYTEYQQRLQAFKARENGRLLENFPELADAGIRARVTQAAGESLKSLGFSPEELQKYWDNEGAPSVHDHRFQTLVMNNIKYQELLAEKEKVAKAVQEKVKTVPPVQKPGSGHKVNATEAEISSLQKRIDNSSGLNALRAAARLTAMQRQSRR